MSSKRVIVCGNWKMNLGPTDGAALAREVATIADSARKTEVWVAPPFLTIPACKDAVHGSRAKLGSQNVHWETAGAFTGEISVPMLTECGCTFALTGHSERRQLFGEDTTAVIKRTAAALRQNFTVILCIGETLEERESGSTEAVLAEQLAPLFADIDPTLFAQLVIAYEPVWAIGTGKVASTDQIAETHGYIAQYWAEKCSASCPPILYGGSVKPDNFKEIIAIGAVSGALVGGASLKADQFRALVAIADER